MLRSINGLREFAVFSAVDRSRVSGVEIGTGGQVDYGRQPTRSLRMGMRFEKMTMLYKLPILTMPMGKVVDGDGVERKRRVR